MFTPGNLSGTVAAVHDYALGHRFAAPVVAQVGHQVMPGMELVHHFADAGLVVLQIGVDGDHPVGIDFERPDTRFSPVRT